MITTNEIKQNQPILYRILKQNFTNNTIPHAFLLVGYNSYDIAHYIAKSIICTNDILACCECNDCHRIEDHNYGDFIFISGKEESIKRKHIDFIQTQFSKSSLEGKARIYLLENIENSSAGAMNSLLKTLEEPEPGVYAILTCNNLNKILPTIQSRCQVIKLLPDSFDYLKKKLIDHNVSAENSSIIVNIFHSFSECEPYIDNNVFIELKEEVYHFIEDMFLHKENLLINVQTHLLKKYKDKNSIFIFLNMLVLALRDLFHVKHSLNYTYQSFKSLYDMISVDDELLISYIDLILQTEDLLNTNANVLLLMDSMIYKIQKGELQWKLD